MHFQVNEAVEVLERTPGVLDALLRGRSAVWLNCRISPDSFSPMDVLGHLIYGEITDWIPRARLILEYRESRKFEPFDRFGFGPLVEGRSLDDLLAQFAELRANNLQALRGFELGETELDMKGMHPELGRVSMRNLLAIWAVHDLGHIAQITRIMSNEYAEAIGPWRRML
jgi:DinB superfamily